MAVVPLVEATQQLDELDGIDVPDAAGVGVVAQQRRRAGAADDVAHAERVGAEQVGLQRHDALLPGRDGEDGFEVRTRCCTSTARLVGLTWARGLLVWPMSTALAAIVLEDGGVADGLVGGATGGRRHLADDDELARGQASA